MKTDKNVIKIRGARVHNLKNIDLDLPLGKLICFAGASGSGKTSLAFHTLLSESKRRFVNSFPNSMKFFSDRPAAVDVDVIFPVLPVFGLPQINPVLGSRSVASDIMRLTELLQGYYYQYSKELCPTHKTELIEVGLAEQLAEKTKLNETDIWHLLAEKDLARAVLGENFSPARSFNQKQKTVREFDEEDEIWEIIRFKRSTLASLNQKNADLILKIKGKPLLLWNESSKKLAKFEFKSNKQCPKCDFASVGIVTTHSFTPHSALGACKNCKGYGANLVYDKNKLIDEDLSVDEFGVGFLKFGPLDWWNKELIKLMKKKKWSTKVPIKELPKEFLKILMDGQGDWEGFEGVKTYLESKRYKPAVRVFIRKLQMEVLCEVCQGSRIDQKVINHRAKFGSHEYALQDFSKMSIEEFRNIVSKSMTNSKDHSQKLLKSIHGKLDLACSIGLDHLNLSRKTRSLSAGEYQRLLLLKYLSFEGTGALFVLDEPSLGLGLAEQKMLVTGLRQIIEQGNSVIIIDHSEYLQKQSDHLIVMGPGSGDAGGEILFHNSTSKYVFKKEKIEKKPAVIQKKSQDYIEVNQPSHYGLMWPSFKIPVGQLIWAHGASGTGKTTCLVRIGANSIYRKLTHQNLVDDPGLCKSIKGFKDINEVILVDSNLNRFTSRSTVGSLTELAPSVRKHFLKLPVAKSMGLKDGHLSSNSELGMCPRCEGRGHLVIEMQYLEDIILPCDDCKGKKIKPIYAELTDGYMTLHEALSRPIGEVLNRIDLTPKFKRTWEYLKILNLEYLSLDRPINTLSGGEKQRLYLLSCLLKNLEDSLVIFENLSFGLASSDLIRIGLFLRDLSQRNNTLIIIDSDPLFAQLADSQLIFSRDNIELKEV
ncbi:MAG: hypothetical protein K2P81_04655 [Bacteriovoracaceae bacterium]|nr:hypothetical protein [Bacteriovoracaceae bacterium]